MRGPSGKSLCRLFVGIGLILAVTAVPVANSDREVPLRSGTIGSDRHVTRSGESDTGGPERWIVRFNDPPGWFEKGAVETAEGRVIAPLPGQAYLVTVPQGRSASLLQVSGVDWASPYLPQDKISPEIAAVASMGAGEDDVIVLLHLFPDASAAAVANELTASGLRVEGSGDGFRFDRIVMRMTPAEVESRPVRSWPSATTSSGSSGATGGSWPTIHRSGPASPACTPARRRQSSTTASTAPARWPPCWTPVSTPTCVSSATGRSRPAADQHRRRHDGGYRSAQGNRGRLSRFG